MIYFVPKTDELLKSSKLVLMLWILDHSIKCALENIKCYTRKAKKCFCPDSNQIKMERIKTTDEDSRLPENEKNARIVRSICKKQTEQNYNEVF